MILGLDKINKEDLLLVGGKAANLGEMTSAGFNVPRGFVITTKVYNQFLIDNNLDKIINKGLLEYENDENALLRESAKFRQKIAQAQFSNSLKNAIINTYSQLGDDARVAVRSSATAEDLSDASFAGQQETYLNVMGVDELLSKVKACFASLWSDRAVS